MVEPGETVLVAVSGGVDSVVLLDLLQQLASDYGVSLHVAHLDHGVRAASSADARFVEQLAGTRGLPIHASRLDPEALGAHRGHGAEGSSREARYAFLRSVAAEIGASRIALGHTADDQTETILYRLARGTGPTGLRGIPPVRDSYVRPLIEITRGEILAYAQERELAWRVDASNADPSFARNLIRHRILPELEAINPRVGEAIRRGSLLAAEAEEVSRFVVAMLWNAIRPEEGEGRLKLPRDALISYPHAVQKLLLRGGAQRVRGNLAGVEHDHIEAAVRLIAGPASHGELSLPGLHVRVQSGEVLLTRARGPTPEPWEYPVEVGETVIPDPPITLKLAIQDAPIDPEPLDCWAELADAERVVFPLELRSRREGDRFAPLGFGKSMKLKDFLINEGVPYFDRDRVPLLCDQEKVVWVVGVRLSDEVRITDATRSVLSMRATMRARQPV